MFKIFKRSNKDSRKDGLTSPVPDKARAVNEFGLRPGEQPPTKESAELVKQLKPEVLQRIFSFVCPHAVDESYETNEESADETCMLCDTRDLSYCFLVNSAWRNAAIGVLYVFLHSLLPQMPPLSAQITQASNNTCSTCVQVSQRAN